MSALATILRRDLVLSGEELDRVLRQEKEEGGNLDTAILELGLLPENTVHAYCAAVYSLSPATRDEVMTASSDVVRSLTAEFALRHRVLPIQRNEYSVVLVVDRPLPEETLHEIAREARLEPLQRIAATARIEAGLAQHFGVELTTRLRKLVEQLDASDPGTVPYVAPYEGLVTRSSLPPRGSLPPGKKGMGVYSMVSGAPGAVESDRVPIREDRVSAPMAQSVRTAKKTDRFVAEEHVGLLNRDMIERARSSSKPVSRNSAQAGNYSLRPGEAEVLGRPTAPPPSSSDYSAIKESAAQAEGQEAQALNGKGSDDLSDTETVEGAPTGQKPMLRTSRPTASPIDELEKDLPNVVIKVGEDIEQLVESLEDATMQTAEAYSKALINTGEMALPALVRAFPGALWTDRNDHVADAYPLGREISAIAYAFSAFGEIAVPYVISLLDHEDDDIRYYSTLLSAEFSDGRMVFPVGRRLFDEDMAIRQVAVCALTQWSDFELEYRRLLERLRAVSLAERDDASRCAAMEALGALKDTGSLNILADALEDSSPDAVAAAYASLVAITYQDFGKSAKRWKAWIAKHSGKDRVDWLIDSLMHMDGELRKAAGKELSSLAQDSFGFDPTSSKKERSIVQRKYRSWWRGESARRAS